MRPTKRQKEVLEFIKEFYARESMPPTVREICGHLGLKSPGGVHRILKELESKGLLSSRPGKKRVWRPTGHKHNTSMPLIGRIAAGQPIDAEENIEERLPFDPSFFGYEGCFCLRVNGDSMTGAHIAHGDLAIIRPQEDVDDGDIAAVLVEDLVTEATLKIVRKVNGGIELHSANPSYPPMTFNRRQGAKVRIVGRLAGIIRRA